MDISRVSLHKDGERFLLFRMIFSFMVIQISLVESILLLW